MIFTNLKKYRIVLASGSPRRYDLLKQTGLDFSVGNNREVHEVPPPGLPVEEVALALAGQKADAWKDEWEKENCLVVTADTVVVLDEQLLGKPAHREEAVDMLKSLSGRSHRVITGVMLCSNELQIGFSEETKVFFRPLSPVQINYYVDRYKPFDKAGAYGIQEWIGLVGIQRIEGSYFNVMGLPVARLLEELERF